MIDKEVQTRLDFMAIDETQRAVLAELQPLVRTLLSPALDRFYHSARRTPETAAFFRDDQHMAHAKRAQESHWLRIATGAFDQEFHASVRRIGAIHAHIGLEPRWYIGAYGLVLENLIRGIARHLSPWRRLLSFFRGPSAADASSAIVKAALLDMELSVSIYFEEAQVERNKAIESLSQALSALADGDLSRDVANMPPAFAAIETSFNQALTSLRGLIGSVMASSAGIRTGSSEIAHASEDLARRTEGTAASLEETSASLVQIDSRLKATAAATAETVNRAQQATDTVANGRATADQAVQAMIRVGESAKGIDSVIEGLDKIAFQTRVLAMNAAVEAGRAGDSGRGFAVVADLVSALAMRAEEEAKRARDQLTVTQADIGTAVNAVKNVDTSLTDISGDVAKVHDLLGSMADDAVAQSSALSEISAAISSMDRTTQQNAAMVEQTSAAARNLTSEVGSLAQQTERFKTGSAAAPAGSAAPRRSARANGRAVNAAGSASVQ
ncbi:globin-coupled sensor protein [Sphingomonas echinoides]|uniref:Protoglobin domain-containing protein n=1 Tax=Sphingomonas echinoides TaxID=59803 RepID=A0ABU4PMT4_9SPHN|nr:globin-coupled sensor protein [Sphingomonas echinoides]MDX5985445.1 protoglobin domain-containing protein [Sphingomonas echinoides]